MVDPTQIRSKMAVVDSAGFPIGTVVGVEGDLIRLTRAGAADGASHFLPLARIERIADERLWLRSSLSDEGVRLSPEALAAGYYGQRNMRDRTLDEPAMRDAGDGTSADAGTFDAA